MAKSIPSSGAGAVRIILKNKDAFHFDLREKKEDNGKQSYLFDVYYENATGTLNVLMDNGEPVIAALNLSLGKVITLSNDTIVELVQNALNEICSKMSYSPSRLQPSLAGCMEFYATSELEENEIDDLLSKLNNDWDGEKDDCQAYSFNTTMFHPNVYYLQFQSF